MEIFKDKTTHLNMGVDRQNARYSQCCDIRGQSNYLFINNPFPNATIEHTKHLRHNRSHEFSFTAAVLGTLEHCLFFVWPIDM